jgi:DNA invertase Pin-like site-specific DNA recombinase
MGVFAEFARSMIVERVRAGVARAKASGTERESLRAPSHPPVDLESESVRLWRLLGGQASTRSQRSPA